MASALHRQAPQFLRRNTFLHGCLGLLSLSERCEALIVAHASPHDAAGAHAGGEPAEGDEELVLALLGLLRLSREFRSVLARLAPQLVPQQRAAEAAPELPLRAWLR